MDMNRNTTGRSQTAFWIGLMMAAVCAWGIGNAQAQTAANEATGKTSPQLFSWFTQNSGRYARVVETEGGKPVATWPSAGLPNMGGGQSQPAYSDIQQISYSQDYVYVKGSGLASHQMGPWYIGVGRIFGNWPTNLNYTHRFPLHPQAAARKVFNGGGALGLWVNGVALFNMLDMFVYNPATGRETQGPPSPGGDIGLWARNAVVVEQPTFDKSNAHQPPNGEYHYHDNPVALRYQLGDNIALDAATGNYREDASHLHHSPILGWSNDGYPIYGPYAYADPKNPDSGVRRMVSGFVLQDGRHHTVDLAHTGRHSIPQWAATLHGISPQLTAAQYGPDVSQRYALGRYVEDFAYLGDLGYTQGKEFDLDIYNGRWCVTPEFPHGTYAYFVTIDEDGSPAFPYVIGRQWYGTPSGGEVRQISETVTLYRDAGPKSAIATRVVEGAGGPQVQWTSVEGGRYKLEASLDGAAWKTLTADVESQGLTTAYRLNAGSATVPYKQFRVTLVSLASYDSIGGRRSMGRPGGPGRLAGAGGPGFGGPGGFGDGPGDASGGPPPDAEGFGGPPPDGPGDGPGNGPPGGPSFGPPRGLKVGAVTPAAAVRGKSVTLTLTLSAGRVPPEFVQPLAVKIGKIKAITAHWDGKTIMARFALPAEAATGKQAVTVTFPGPPGADFTVTFTRIAAFTVQ
jgi:hypothetical protein